MQNSPKQLQFCIVPFFKRLLNGCESTQGNPGFIDHLLSMSDAIHAPRKSALLSKAGPSVSAILPLCGESQVTPAVVPRIIVDVIDDFVGRDINAHQCERQPVGTVENGLASTLTPPQIENSFAFRKNCADANLNRRAMVAALPALFGPSFVSCVIGVPDRSLMGINKMMNWPDLPSQDSRLGVVVKALLEKASRKLVDVFHRMRILTLEGYSRLSFLFFHGMCFCGLSGPLNRVNSY